jgi:hypothetical protein
MVRLEGLRLEGVKAVHAYKPSSPKPPSLESDLTAFCQSRLLMGR